LVVTSLRVANHRLALLVEQCREEQETGTFDREATGPFTDPALSENQDLFPTPKGIDNDCPFFKRRAHRSTVPAVRRVCNGAANARPWSFIPGFSKISEAFNNAMTAAIEKKSDDPTDVAAKTKAAIDSALNQ